MQAGGSTCDTRTLLSPAPAPAPGMISVTLPTAWELGCSPHLTDAEPEPEPEPPLVPWPNIKGLSPTTLASARSHDNEGPCLGRADLGGRVFSAPHCHHGFHSVGGQAACCPATLHTDSFSSCPEH